VAGPRAEYPILHRRGALKLAKSIGVAGALVIIAAIMIAGILYRPIIDVPMELVSVASDGSYELQGIGGHDASVVVVPQGAMIEVFEQLSVGDQVIAQLSQSPLGGDFRLVGVDGQSW
jgi:hypothetical protein